MNKNYITWDEVKKKITSLTEKEKMKIDLMSDMISEKIEKRNEGKVTDILEHIEVYSIVKKFDETDDGKRYSLDEAMEILNNT
jgi:hypothetical protein